MSDRIRQEPLTPNLAAPKGWVIARWGHDNPDDGYPEWAYDLEVARGDIRRRIVRVQKSALWRVINPAGEWDGKVEITWSSWAVKSADEARAFSLALTDAIKQAEVWESEHRDGQA